MSAPIKTTDERYIVVEGKQGPRLWRASNPKLDAHVRQHAIDQLMAARRAISGSAISPEKMIEAREQVQQAKQALGERGPVWWTDGAPDLNRHLVKNTPYQKWWLSIRH